MLLCDWTDLATHPGYNSVCNEGLDSRNVALWVVNGNKDVFINGTLLLLFIQSELVDHGVRRVGHGVALRQGRVLDQQTVWLLLA